MRYMASYRIAYIFILAAFVSLMQSCKSSSDPSKNFTLPDSLFVMRNISGSQALANIYFHDGNAYTDSTRKVRFSTLTQYQKLRLVAHAGLFDSSYLSYIDAYFIARQNPIGNYTPIILHISGDDYSAVQLILLDTSLNPVAHYTLHGGECGGPASDDGKTMEYCPEIQSTIKDDEIRTYVLHIFVSDDSASLPARIDSISYLSKILPTGKIETRKLDSVSYNRVINSGEFRDL